MPMIFYTIINNSDAVISFVTHLTHLGTHHMGTVNVEQVNHIGDLVFSLKGQMQQHLIDNGVSLYPLSSLVSLTNSFLQIADYHDNKHDFCLSVARMPMLPNEERPDWAKKALSHLQAKVECDQFTSQAQISLDYLKHLGVGHVWPHIIG